MITIKTSRNALLTPLQKVAGIVERRHTLPILSNVLIENRGGRASLSATDLEVQIRTASEIALKDEAESVTIGAKKLQDILRSLPDDAEIVLDGKESRLTLKAGKSRFSLQTLPAADFPKLADSGAELSTFSLNRKIFKVQLEKVQYAMANQDIRYYLNGMLLSVTDGKLITVATDGHRLSFAASEMVGGDSKAEVILPRKTVAELIKLLDDGDAAGSVHVTVRTNQVKFDLGETELSSKLIDGKFPDYTKVIPAGYSKHITLNRIRLQQALNRAAILSNEKIRGVRVVLTKDSMNVVCSNNEQEEAQEELAITYDGEPLDVGFNVTYLLDVLNHSDTEDVVWSFGDANSSSLITVPGDEQFKYVVMPMRI
jgi:DNA polymerase III subunit beta